MQHIRDFDAQNPGCCFAMNVVGGTLTLAETVAALKSIDPPFATVAVHPKIELAIGDLPEGVASWMATTTLSPCCHGHSVAGPKGGLSQNCWCPSCHARFNVIFTQPEVDWGQVTALNDPEFPK